MLCTCYVLQVLCLSGSVGAWPGADVEAFPGVFALVRSVAGVLLYRSMWNAGTRLAVCVRLGVQGVRCGAARPDEHLPLTGTRRCEAGGGGEVAVNCLLLRSAHSGRLGVTPSPLFSPSIHQKVQGSIPGVPGLNPPPTTPTWSIKLLYLYLIPI